jgi:hypothetical protein
VVGDGFVAVADKTVGVGGVVVGVTVGGKSVNVASDAVSEGGAVVGDRFVAVADDAVGVGGMVVGVTVDGKFVGVGSNAAGEGGTVVGGEVGVGAVAQAAMKITARVSTVIGLLSLDIFLLGTRLYILISLCLIKHSAVTIRGVLMGIFRCNSK